jgi:isopentenyl phosphate kinase
MSKLVFLKLGGSVITDKDNPNTANLQHIGTIAKEIAQALTDDPGITLLIGHGSGSFGHHAAHQYGTRNGVKTLQDWKGFVEVAARARELNQIVIEHLQQAGINVLSISPFSGVMANNHKFESWDISIIKQCLCQSLVPVIYGDVILDRQLGGTILSTEELFSWLAIRLNPDRILLAGIEEGVWRDFPERTQFVEEIHPNDFLTSSTGIKTSTSTDVTGGMYSKVSEMVRLVETLPNLEIQIFSGARPGNIHTALMGTQKGTWIRNPEG